MATKFDVKIKCLKCGSYDVYMQASYNESITLECNKCGETEEIE